MDRLDKKTLISQMNSKYFYVGFFTYEEFKNIRRGFIKNQVVSLYEDVYNIDDCFIDKPFILLVKKSSINSDFKPVNIVENPRTIYEKNDNDFLEIKAEIEYLDIEFDFFYVRENKEKG